MPKRDGGIREPVAVTAVTAGRKLGRVAATYVAQPSCPDGCVFRKAGCYAENGFLGGFITKRLNRAQPGIGRDELARREADGIDALPADRDLRLHVVGDCATLDATLVVAAASERYIERGRAAGRSVRVWTYTHAWRDVPRWAWGGVSVLASCETPAAVVEAWGRGYAAELTLDRHRGAKRYGAGPLNVLPCPEQTTPGVTCETCRLCTDDARLLEQRIVIAFAVHGSNNTTGPARRSLHAARLRDREVVV